MAKASMPNKRVIEVLIASGRMPQKIKPNDPSKWQMVAGPRIIRSKDGVLGSIRSLVMRTAFPSVKRVKRIAYLGGIKC